MKKSILFCFGALALLFAACDNSQLLDEAALQSVPNVATDAASKPTATIAPIQWTMLTDSLITVNYTTGTGFVGKGVIQSPWGWNNAYMQAYAGGIKFCYKYEATYLISEEWYTATNEQVIDTVATINNKGVTVYKYVKTIIKVANQHTATKTVTSYVNGAIAYDARTHKQVDGFNLLGYSGLVIIGGEVVPEVGAITVDRQNQREANPTIVDGMLLPTDTKVTAVETVSSTLPGLYASYGL